jgi:hypothetical protein
MQRTPLRSAQQLPSSRPACGALRTTLPLLLTLAVALGCNSTPTVPVPITERASIDALKKSVEYLASDDMEGRGIGTEGLELAAKYIAGYFGGLGLQPPPGNDDYFQPFEHTTIAGVGDATKLSVNDKAYQTGEDFQPQAMSAEKTFSGNVVFVGYGISGAKSLSGEEYDDYAGVDVTGKVVLALRFEPKDDTGKSRLSKEGWSDHAAIARKAKSAADRGAVAFLYVHPPTHHGPEMLTPLARARGEAQSIPVLQVRQAVAEELLRIADAGALSTYQSAIDKSFAPRSVVLRKVNVDGAVEMKRTSSTLKNVTACLPGKGKLAKEYIVVGAHYDHLGRGGFGSRSPRSNEIHNGADDNASGTAGMLEIARLLSRAPDQQGRSVLFVAFTGEEQGLLGSQHWVEHPPVPLESVKAMINLDMIGRIAGTSLMIGGTATSAAFPPLITLADAQSPLEMKTVWANGFAPTDTTSFVARRIPVLFFWSGTHVDYHRPTDDADKINYEGAAETVNIVANVLQELRIRRDLYYSAGPTTGPSTQESTPGLRAGGASLGVIPTYGEDEGASGMKIQGTSPGSPAEKAGLKPGDVLTAIGDRKITSVYGLTDVLNERKAGDVVEIKFLRDGMEHSTEATLAERRSRQ